MPRWGTPESTIQPSDSMNPGILSLSFVHWKLVAAILFPGSTFASAINDLATIRSSRRVKFNSEEYKMNIVYLSIQYSYQYQFI